MLRKIVVLLTMACMCYAFNANAAEDSDDTYLYRSVCPSSSGGKMHQDDWSFYKCECTSYVAHKLNENGIPFDNSYRLPEQVYWHGAGHWKGVAEYIGIETDSVPYPGDVAWWSGHVAYVERVDYDDNGQWTKVYISEYNYTPPYGHEYGKRNFTPNDDDKPQTYIHVKSIDYRFISDANGYNSVSIAWLPADVPCNKASVWAYNETCSAENNHSSICQTAYDELVDIDSWKYDQSDWYTIFFGSIDDFQDLCY